MNEMWGVTLAELPPESVPIAVGGVAVAGMLYCFFGYRVFKFVLGFTGFMLAGAIAALGVGLLTEGRLPFVGIAWLLGGLVGAFAMLFLYKLGVFGLGALGALLIAHYVLRDRPESWVMLGVLAAALAGGVVALLIEPPIMTIVTAAIGAWALIGCGLYLVHDARFADPVREMLSAVDPDLVFLAGWGGLAVIGALVQFATYRKKTVPG